MTILALSYANHRILVPPPLYTPSWYFVVEPEKIYKNTQSWWYLQTVQSLVDFQTAWSRWFHPVCRWSHFSTPSAQFSSIKYLLLAHPAHHYNVGNWCCFIGSFRPVGMEICEVAIDASWPISQQNSCIWKCKFRPICWDLKSVWRGSPVILTYGLSWHVHLPGLFIQLFGRQLQPQRGSRNECWSYTTFRFHLWNTRIWFHIKVFWKTQMDHRSRIRR